MQKKQAQNIKGGKKTKDHTKKKFIVYINSKNIGFPPELKRRKS